MPKYKLVDVGGGHQRRAPTTDDDPIGREAWELSGKWETKPGRKPKSSGAKIPVNLRLPQELVDWLREQPAGITGTIEGLIERERAG